MMEVVVNVHAASCMDDMETSRESRRLHEFREWQEYSFVLDLLFVGYAARKPYLRAAWATKRGMP